MMRQRAWLAWSLATVGLWIAFVWFGIGPSLAKEKQLAAERSEWLQRRKAANALLTAAPKVVRQTAEVNADIRDHVSRLVSVDDISRLLRELRELGQRQGCGDIKVIPDHDCIVALPVERQSVGKEAFVPVDTLILEFVAEGRFRAVGAWLDAIEQRADFREWYSCHWEEGAERAEVVFSGTGVFWIDVANSKASLLDE